MDTKLSSRKATDGRQISFPWKIWDWNLNIPGNLDQNRMCSSFINQGALPKDFSLNQIFTGHYRSNCEQTDICANNIILRYEDTCLDQKENANEVLQKFGGWREYTRLEHEDQGRKSIWAEPWWIYKISMYGVKRKWAGSFLGMLSHKIKWSSFFWEPYILWSWWSELYL